MAAFLVLALMGIGAPAARAGTYDVYACDTPAGAFTNHSWAVRGHRPAGDRATGTVRRAGRACSSTRTPIKLYDPGTNMTMTFRAPAGAAIADFRLHRYVFEFNPLNDNPGREKLYILGQLGAVPFELVRPSGPCVAERLSTPVGDGAADGEACQSDETVTRASFPALAGLSR